MRNELCERRNGWPKPHPALIIHRNCGLGTFMPCRFAIGPWVLDTESNTVNRDGRVIRLEPKVVEVCVCLADRAGEVVRKEELIRAVWPDTFVTDDVLTKAISELRKALEDDAKRPQFIETIPKRGYRLIASNTSTLSKLPPSGEPPFGPRDVKGEGSTEISAAGSLSPTTIEPTRPTISRNPSAGGLEAKPAKKDFLSRRVAVTVTAIVVLGLAVSTSWWLFSRKRQTLTEKDAIVLADFTNTTGDAIFDDTLKQALATALEQSPFLNVLSNQKVSETLHMMDRSSGDHITLDIAREICQRTGSTAVLGGSIANLGSQYVIGLSATSCASGDSLAREEVQASRKEEVLNVLGNAATSLRKRLGESLTSIQKFDTPLEQATTSSLEALKAFSLAARPNNSASGTLLHRAIELDPNFADAYVQLSARYDNAGEAELASQYAQKAFDHRDHATERERLFISSMYQALVLGDLDQEMSILHAMEQMYPRDWGAWNDSASDLIPLGDYTRALEEGQEALRLNPNQINPYLNSGRALLALNRRDEVKQLAQRAQARGLDMNDIHILLYEVAFLENDRKEMEAQLAPYLARTDEEAFDALVAQSRTEAYSGRLKSALVSLERGLEIVRRHDHELAAQVKDAEALDEAEFGNPAEARQAASTALTLSTGRNARLFTALALARAGDTTRAQALADELNRQFPSNTLMQRYWLPTIRGSIEFARKNPAKAVDALKHVSYELGDADAGTLTGNLYPVYVRGQAYLGMHQGKAAAAEFQKFLDHPSIVLNSPLGALAHLGLARAYSLQGDTAKARGAYQDFLALWKEADPDVPILKEAKAEYAKLQ